MDNDVRFVISRNAYFQIDRNGQTVATTSLSREPQTLSDSEYDILKCFAAPSSVQQAHSAFRDGATIGLDAFRAAVEKLRRSNILITVGLGSSEDGYLPASGFGAPAHHHGMLRDYFRVMSYRTAIAAHVKDKVVLEIGCGTGILSIFSAQAGASHVFAIEESQVGALAREMFEANGVKDKITLLVGNSKDIDLPERVDVIIHEILGADPYFENMIPYVNDACKRFLREGGRLIPYRVDVCCIGIEPEFIPSLAHRSLREAREFRGIYGLDFDPYIRAIEGMEELNDLEYTHRRGGGGLREAIFDQAMLSEECVVRSIDLYDELGDVGTEVPATMRISNAGCLGSILLYFRAHLDERVVLSTCPSTPKTSWGWIRRDLPQTYAVKPGDEIELVSRVTEVEGSQRLRIKVR